MAREEDEMTEVLIEYDVVMTADDGSRWVARAVGRPGNGTMWDGWIEFVPLSAGVHPVRSRRESTQPSQESLVYWATGLTPVYLKGALDRALEVPVRRAPARRIAPLFDGPAPEPEVIPSPSPATSPRPILDPFDVYAQGEDILIRQLDALDTPRLRDIVHAYELMSAKQTESATRLDLATAIVDAARAAATRA
jgi:hypothetical protein